MRASPFVDRLCAHMGYMTGLIYSLQMGGTGDAMVGRYALALAAGVLITLGFAGQGWAQSEEGGTSGEEPAPAGESADAEGEGAERHRAPESGEAVERSVSAPDERDAGRYAVRLRDLETRISMLQEQILRSKARLSLLAESVISGVIAGSKATVVYRNQARSGGIRSRRCADIQPDR